MLLFFLSTFDKSLKLKICFESVSYYVHHLDVYNGKGLYEGDVVDIGALQRTNIEVRKGPFCPTISTCH